MDTPNGRPSLQSPSPSPSPSPAPPLPPSRPSSSTTPSPSPLREDCWTEDATSTLVEAWGQRYLTLNRGNLRQHHWQEVADAVTARHSRRTDIQCKNRIDTLKKKYKLEKARVLDSKSTYTSTWPFFASIDALIGSNFPAKTTSSFSPAAASENSEKENPTQKPKPRPALNFSSPVPVRPRSNKRTAREQFPLPLLMDDSNSRRRVPAVKKDKESSEKGSGKRRSGMERERSRNMEMGMEMELGLGFRELAEAVERLGDIYERVEKRKQREMWELEKVRMEFTKELEEGRMKFFGEMQLYLHKMNKKSRGLSMADAYSWMAM